MIDVFIRQIFICLHAAIRNLTGSLAVLSPFSFISTSTLEGIHSPFAVDSFSDNSGFEHGYAKKALLVCCPATMPAMQIRSHSWQQPMQQAFSEAIMLKSTVGYKANGELLI